VFNDDDYEDDSICTPEHEAVLGLLEEAIYQATLVQDCNEECSYIHAVLSAAYLACIGVDDEEIYRDFGLPWISERP